METYGAERVVAGDLVLLQDDAARAAARNRGASQQQQQQQDGSAGAAGGEGEAAAEAPAAQDDEAAAAEHTAAAEVHVVTAEEAAEGRYSIDDVVLPLPGSETVYPQHATAEVYQQLAAADGVSLEAAPHGCLDFSIAELRGGYRRLLHRPSDLEVSEGRIACACSCLVCRAHRAQRLRQSAGAHAAAAGGHSCGHPCMPSSSCLPASLCSMS